MTLDELKERYSRVYMDAQDEVMKQTGMDGTSTGTNVSRLHCVIETAKKLKWKMIEEYGRSEYRRGFADGERAEFALE